MRPEALGNVGGAPTGAGPPARGGSTPPTFLLSWMLTWYLVVLCMAFGPAEDSRQTWLLISLGALLATPLLIPLFPDDNALYYFCDYVLPAVPQETQQSPFEWQRSNASSPPGAPFTKRASRASKASKAGKRPKTWTTRVPRSVRDASDASEAFYSSSESSRCTISSSNSSIQSKYGSRTSSSSSSCQDDGQGLWHQGSFQVPEDLSDLDDPVEMRFRFLSLAPPVVPQTEASQMTDADLVHLVAWRGTPLHFLAPDRTQDTGLLFKVVGTGDRSSHEPETCRAAWYVEYEYRQSLSDGATETVGVEFPVPVAPCHDEEVRNFCNLVYAPAEAPLISAAGIFGAATPTYATRCGPGSIEAGGSEHVVDFLSQCNDYVLYYAVGPEAELELENKTSGTSMSTVVTPCDFVYVPAGWTWTLTTVDDDDQVPSNNTNANDEGGSKSGSKSVSERGSDSDSDPVVVLYPLVLRDGGHAFDGARASLPLTFPTALSPFSPSPLSNMPDSMITNGARRNADLLNYDTVETIAFVFGPAEAVDNLLAATAPCNPETTYTIELSDVLGNAFLSGVLGVSFDVRSTFDALCYWIVVVCHDYHHLDTVKNIVTVGFGPQNSMAARLYAAKLEGILTSLRSPVLDPRVMAVTDQSDLDDTLDVAHPGLVAPWDRHYLSSAASHAQFTPSKISSDVSSDISFDACSPCVFSEFSEFSEFAEGSPEGAPSFETRPAKTAETPPPGPDNANTTKAKLD